MSSIIHVQGREILDSRGFPTVEAEVMLSSGVMARAAVPSGASTGKYEAVELRDENPDRFNGKGVLKAIANINELISPAINDFDILNQFEIDNRLIELDGTENKSNLGANAILAVSLAAAKAASRHLGVPLHRYIGGQWANLVPIPMANILNGGQHADGNVDIQEFMVIPLEAPNIREGIRWVAEIFHCLKAILKEKGYTTSVGDEGGFAPSLRDNEEAIELILEAIEKAGYQGKIRLALDVAASEMVQEKTTDQYCFWKSSKKVLDSDQMVNFWIDLIKKYPDIISIEDPLGEDDWDGWKNLTKELSGKPVQIVGDDLFVTNTKFLKKGIEEKVGNSILVKVNQIGTLTETMKVVQLAKQNGYSTVISHRSGETEDTTIADLAVALNTGQIKTGSLSRTDRVAKYNQLIRLEEQLGEIARYSIQDSFPNLF